MCPHPTYLPVISNSYDRMSTVADSGWNIVNRVVTCSAFGGLAFMALIGWILAFDVASIATLTADTAKKDILSALIVGGAITKGIVLGAAVGMVSPTWGRAKPSRTRA